MALVKRSDKVAFLETATGVFTRMKGFTSLSVAKNPREYSRQYVDDNFETTDVVGYTQAIDYAFDEDDANATHTKIVTITDGEKTDDDALVTIVQVDFTTAGVPASSFVAVKRQFAVVPSAEGDGAEAYTHSGSFKVKGARVIGTVTTTDAWATCVFLAD
ncbi:MAG: hypothetical protein K0M69_15740 [Youngiibacter sp.]|nr:hypothetical protein [Youngiibacter sp.]